MNRTREQLTNRMVDRRTLLGGSVGVAAAITLRPAFGFAQDAAVSGDISYWHHFTSDSEMAGLEQITEHLRRRISRHPSRFRKYPQCRLHDPIHDRGRGWGASRIPPWPPPTGFRTCWPWAGWSI